MARVVVHAGTVGVWNLGADVVGFVGLTGHKGADVSRGSYSLRESLGVEGDEMTTDADTGNQIDAAEVWRAIGRLEGDTAALKEGQREIQAGIRDLQAGLRDVNRQVDHLFYAILAVGGALLAAFFASRFI